ncbi:MAG: Hpt domain-containing protein [Sandaracinaceae bacterium]|nr:Hpt domain-containing protein [Sandaracinaceae bacterium]
MFAGRSRVSFALKVGLPLFDSSVLDRLAAQAKSHGDAHLVRELVADAITSILHCASELEAAIGAGDMARARSHAHRLKSVLRQVGALRMGEAAARTESLATVDDEATHEAARRVLSLRDETTAALRAHLELME